MQGNTKAFKHVNDDDCDDFDEKENISKMHFWINLDCFMQNLWLFNAKLNPKFVAALVSPFLVPPFS